MNIFRNKKIIVIFVLLIILLAGISFYLLNSKKVKLSSPTTTTPLNTPKPLGFSESFDINEAIKKESLEIDDIKVKNFYKQSLLTGSDGYSLFVKTSKYKIMYIPVDNSFLISIIDNPFEKIRLEAEGSLLKNLGIGKDEACGLTVNITTPYNINPANSGENYKLSFCE